MRELLLVFFRFTVALRRVNFVTSIKTVGLEACALVEEIAKREKETLHK